jgi:hypothetical protein
MATVAMNDITLHSLLTRHHRILAFCFVLALALSACQQPIKEERFVDDPDSPLVHSLVQISDLPQGYSLEYSLMVQEPVTPTLENHQHVEQAWLSFTVKTFNDHRLIITHDLNRYAQQAPLSVTLESLAKGLEKPVLYVPTLSTPGQVISAGCARQDRETYALVVCEIVINYDSIVSRLKIIGTDTRGGETINSLLNQLLNVVASRIASGIADK